MSKKNNKNLPTVDINTDMFDTVVEIKKDNGEKESISKLEIAVTNKDSGNIKFKKYLFFIKDYIETNKKVAYFFIGSVLFFITSYLILLGFSYYFKTVIQ